MQKHKTLLLIACIFATWIAPLVARADETDPLKSDKAKAIAIAKESGYEHLITQYAGKGDFTNQKWFTQWILDEINNDSVMRAEIGDALDDFEKNGHNTTDMTFYYSLDKNKVARRLFKEKDVTIKCTGKKTDGNYGYEVQLRATDGFHGGYTAIVFHFSFEAKVEYFKFTKAYMITVVAYPLFEKEDEQQHDQ